MGKHLCAASLACLLAGSASATVLFKGDLETGNLSQWDELEGLPERIGAVTSPVRQGLYAMRVELRNGDYSNGGCRNELDRAALEHEGDERYYAWSTMFDASYPSNKTWQVFTQWHHTGSNGSPPVELDVDGERITLLTGGDHEVWGAPLVRGVWHDFILHVVWSSSATKGVLELWYDGVRVLAPLSIATSYANQGVYLKQGLYRDATIQQTAIVFHDGMTVATALADVAPFVQPPPATDGGTDAGTVADGGAAADAGSGADAGAIADAGGSGDAGGSADAGSITDGGSASDAGSASGGTADAGGSAAADAGTADQVALGFPGFGPGTGCSSAGSASALLLLVAGAWTLRRRR